VFKQPGVCSKNGLQSASEHGTADEGKECEGCEGMVWGINDL